MHELALSQDIVRTVLSAVEAEPSDIVAIALDVGTLSSVNVDSLEFCMGVILEQEGMDGVRVEITEVPARVRCSCGAEYEPEEMFDPCPQCDGFDREVIRGTDLTIRHVEVRDEQG
jgi:hydrogenase nickel incorporation protein HypA/HybF